MMRPKSLREIQQEIVPKSFQDHIFKSYDQMGDIAILDIPEELVPYEKKIAQALLKEHKTIKTVCKKIGSRAGTYRRQKLKILAGKRTKETIHKECGAQLKLHVEKVYFSPRMSTERLRIAQQVKPGENILVLFSGCAPYPCVIAKNAKPKSIVAVELNPIAHKYALENIRLNKLSNVEAICGDVRKIVPKLKGSWDRIVMAFPHGGEAFLDIVIKAATKGTIIHFYDFAAEEEFPKVEQKLLDACKKASRACKIVFTKQCGQNAPRTFRVVVDFILEN